MFVQRHNLALLLRNLCVQQVSLASTKQMR